MTRFVKPLVLGFAFLGMPLVPGVKACTLWGAAGKFAGQSTISQTIASWIVENPAHGPPKLRVVLVNPGQPDTLQSFVLDTAFWQATK